MPRWWLDPDILNLGDDIREVVRLGLLSSDEMIREIGVASLVSFTQRDRVLDPRNPVSAVCRPYARIKTVPFYSRHQVEEYRRIAAEAATHRAHPHTVKFDLPLIDPTRRVDYWSSQQMTYHVQYKGKPVGVATIGRWISSSPNPPQAYGMPPEKASAVTPITVYAVEEATEWLRGFVPTRRHCTFTAYAVYPSRRAAGT